MEHENIDEGDMANRSTKKVRIREAEGDLDVVMDSVPTTRKPLSWKDCLLGTGFWADKRTKAMNNFDSEGDFELSSVNGILSIHFSEQVNQLIIKDMTCTVIIKLLDRKEHWILSVLQ
ncbi:hypothetical protein J1N35_024430 [Gossypium stocksii]|uniref:Uncharacterized protein n=1 Tax=Gossypium stocksii TaxID=47602 RepID=A0A9D3V4B5_9ROSI|nr:hypothetical protein J1N35_024430 [Gossypium stocksii]